MERAGEQPGDIELREPNDIVAADDKTHISVNELGRLVEFSRRKVMKEKSKMIMEGKESQTYENMFVDVVWLSYFLVSSGEVRVWI